MKKESNDFVVDQSRSAPFKFAYSLGDRPLDGYTIKRGIGRGGFGEVYFATSDAGKEVALKLVRRNFDIEIRGVTQCLNLKHHNLISIYDLRGDEQSDQWVIMEYVSGASLDEELARHPNGMPEDRINWWMQGICSAVSYLHDHGIVHRDLKPGNIFSDEGMVKVGDYGLAKFISCSRRSGQTESVGTVHYMAPEIANGRYGKEIDIYALGIMLYEMIVGAVPFEGESVGEILMKHLTAEPDLLRLPSRYQEVVRRALTKDPAERFQSVGEMVAILPGMPAEMPLNQPAPTGGAAAVQAAFHEQPVSETAETIPHKKQATGHDDPLWNATVELGRAIERKWVEAPIPAWLKFVMSMGAIFLLIVSSTWWVPLLFVLFIGYGIYYATRILFVDKNAKRSEQRNGKLGKASQRRKQGFSPFRSNSAWKEEVRIQLAAKSKLKKTTELIGSMLLALFVAAIVAMIGPLLLGDQGAEKQLVYYIWLVAVGTLACWAAMIPSKLIEGNEDDQMPLRFTQMVLGGCVGGFAWLLGQGLLLELPHWPDFGNEPGDAVITEIFTGVGMVTSYPHGQLQPTFAGSVVYFALLFLSVRWWRQADYTRSRRLAVHHSARALFWAWLLHIFWWFPQPAGVAVVAVTTISLQIASPWFPTSQRKLLEQQATEQQATLAHQPA